MELTNTIHNNPQYANWLSNLKDKVRNARIKASISVNRELLLFYWDLGADIVQKQAQSNWGDGFLNQLSKDLMAEFPDMKGFSLRNLKYIKQWYLFYSGTDITSQITKQAASQLSDSDNKENSQQLVGQIGQQPVAQLKQPGALITRIPWGHNITIISKSQVSSSEY
jgi:predicted nuclease of restriction endonuclease-like (RecB) superfamily